MRNDRMIQLFLGVLCFCLITMGASFAGAAEKRTLSIATGGSGGTYFVIGGGMGKLVEKYLPGVKLMVQSTAASTENIRLVGAKKVDFAIAMPDSAYFARNGEREFARGKEKYENIRGVIAGHASILQGLVLESSGIKTMADLKGKKVALSAPSSPSMYVAMAALEAYGLKEGDYKGLFMTYAEMSDAVKSGSIDCGFVFAGAPSAAVLDITSNTNVRILGMDKAKLNAVTKKYPYFSAGKIKANTYKGQTEDLFELITPAILITHADMNAETVYDITKVVLEHTKELTAIHPSGAEWDPEDAAVGLGVPLHPGAEKYLKEKKIIK